MTSAVKRFFHPVQSCLILSLIVLACGLCSCRSVPVTGRSQFLLTTESYENSLGAESYEEYKAEYPVSKNAEYNAALARCGNAIKAVAGADEFEWEFTVLDSEIQNAFCLPGGKVAVYSGIMDSMANEAELAFVVGHEIGHAIARHGGERMSRSILQSLGAVLVSAAFNSETIDAIYGTGTELGVMLPYSRSNESEADIIGLVLMARAGYDPSASYTFWRRFTNNAEGSSKLESILSTHPCDSDRIRAMEENEPMAREEYNKAPTKYGFGRTFTRKK
ncbi:MAG: M48 family metallopeptidase [Lentisphaeria bacterium]|nr:M48 family metallopeptidase [Lentisphaeria bacterium]